MSDIYNDLNLVSSHKSEISQAANVSNAQRAIGSGSETNITGQKQCEATVQGIIGVPDALSALTTKSAEMIQQVSDYLQSLDQGMMG